MFEDETPDAIQRRLEARLPLPPDEAALLRGYYMGFEAAMLAMSKLSTLSGMRPTPMDPRDIAWQISNYFDGPIKRWITRREKAIAMGRPGEHYWEHAPIYTPPSDEDIQVGDYPRSPHRLSDLMEGKD
jgi:hypothetical protein